MQFRHEPPSQAYIHSDFRITQHKNAHKKPVEKTLKHFIHFSSYASLYFVIHTPEYHNRKCFSLVFFLAKPLNWYSPTPSNLNKHLHPTFFSIHCNSQSFIYFTAWHPLILIFETLFLNGSYAGSIEIQGQKC